MEVIHAIPAHPLIQSLVEVYYFIHENEPREVSTLPNARVDAAITLAGTIHWYYPDERRFKPLPACCFFGLTNTIGRAQIHEPLHCVSIKFYPHVLALRAFASIRLTEPVGFDQVFHTPDDERQLIQALHTERSIDNWIALLDTYFLNHLMPDAQETWLQKIIRRIEADPSDAILIQTLADEAHISIKTLERRFLNAMGLTPKQYARIAQLQYTARTIRRDSTTLERGDLLESLGTGYYDQSHFVKACRAITGLSPRKLFAAMGSPLSDLLTEQPKD